MKIIKDQQGIAHLFLGLFIMVVLGVGATTYYVYTKNHNKEDVAFVQDDENLKDDGSVGYSDSDGDDGADTDNDAPSDIQAEDADF